MNLINCKKGNNINVLHFRIDLITDANRYIGGAYVYSNQLGCDGDKIYFDGCCLVSCNGTIITAGSQSKISNEYELVFCDIDIEMIRQKRQLIQLNTQAHLISIKRICIPACITKNIESPTDIKKYDDTRIYSSAGQQLADACTSWLWDYFIESKAKGFFVALSGGIDSAASAFLIFYLCNRIVASQYMFDRTSEVFSKSISLNRDAKSVCKYAMIV